MKYKNIIKRFLPWIGSVDMETPRRDWLKAALLEVESGSRVLDAGAGTQRNKEFCAHLEYISQDFAQYDGTGNNKGLQTGEFPYGELDIVSDITEIPEKDGSFDVVMCIEVLEHLPDPVIAIKELSRLLVPGGRLLLSAPFCSLTHFAPYHFSTGFNRYWYEHHLPKYGLKIIEAKALGGFFDSMRQELYRTRYMVNKYCDNKVGFFTLLLIFLLQRKLFLYSLRDQGSSEILCDGYLLEAEKI